MSVASWCCKSFCASFWTGHFVMVPLNMTYLHCLQHSLFEHLFNFYYEKEISVCYFFLLQIYIGNIRTYLPVRVVYCGNNQRLPIPICSNIADLLITHIETTSCWLLPKFFILSKKQTQEAPQCDETRLSTIQPSIDVTEIRNESWHTHTPSLVSIGQSKLMLLSGHWISIFNNSWPLLWSQTPD